MARESGPAFLEESCLMCGVFQVLCAELFEDAIL